MNEYRLTDGRTVVVLAEGRLVNLSAAEGHPPAVMDMSFANQALSVEYLVKNAGSLKPQVYPVPQELDEQVRLYPWQSEVLGVAALAGRPVSE